MNQARWIPVSSLLALTLLALGCGPHAHTHEAPANAELEPVGTTVFGERVLLYLEYEPLVQDQPARFLAHFSVLATGEPVRAGRVTLTVDGDGLIAAAPKRDGLFVPEGSFARAGRFAARLELAGPDAAETLDLGAVEVFASDEAARAAQAGEEHEDPSGAVPFLLEQQWRVKLLLHAAGPRTLARRLRVPAQVRTPEGLQASLSSPVAGRVLAPAGVQWPQSGDQVAAGQLLAEVEPPIGAADLAQLQALRLELDLKALDIVRALDEAQARHDYAQREVERIERLRARGLSTQQELEAAQRDLRVAQSEHEVATATQSSLEQLAAQRAPAANASSSSGVARWQLAAPVAGTIVAVPRVHGTAVEAGEELFRIVDASRVWIEGRVGEFDLPRLSGTLSGFATLAALPDRRVELGGGEPLRLLPGLDPTSRTAVLRCEVPNVDGALHAGMLAELELALERVDAAVALPVEAIVMDQGEPTAYVLLEGELFQERTLQLGVEDGDVVEVLSGIAPGERVATRGAYLVKLAAASPATFGAGHQH